MKHCSQVELKFGQVLNFADEPIEYVYFPTSGFIALLIVMPHEQSIAVNLVGSEGVLGATLALGNLNSPMMSVVQGAGYALRIDRISFEHSMKKSLRFRQLVHSYLYVSIRQLARSSACNNFHDVRQRLARLILMIQDRVHSDHIYLTHHFLSTMLGARRSAVTIAAGVLQRKGSISYSRGHLKVVSRAHLTQLSCGCYIDFVDSYQKNLKSIAE